MIVSSVVQLALELPVVWFLVKQGVLFRTTTGPASLANILLAVVAILFGSMALAQISARGERGRFLATTGLVIGIVEFLPYMIIVLNSVR